MDKAAVDEVGVGTVGLGEIGFGKGGFFGQAARDKRFLQIKFHKGSVAEIAIVEGNPLQLANFGPVDPDELAILKLAALKAAIFNFTKTQITIFKVAIAEAASLELSFAEIAILKGAVIESNGRYHYHAQHK